MQDEETKDDEHDADLPIDDDIDTRKKLLDEDVESLDDLEEEELDLDKEDLMDDVEEM